MNSRKVTSMNLKMHIILVMIPNMLLKSNKMLRKNRNLGEYQ